MSIYIISFCISLLFFSIAANEYKFNEYTIVNSIHIDKLGFNKKKSYLYLFLSIIIMSLLGGLRAYTIGTDVGFYVISDFSTAKAYNDYFKFICLDLGREKGYLTLVYIVAKLTPGNYKTDLCYLLFVLSFFTVGISYKALLRMRNNNDAIFAVLIYLLMHYNGTYNAVRQYLAESIILLAISYLNDRNYTKYVIIILFASLFHSGSIIMLVLPLIHILTNKYKDKKRDTLYFSEIFIFVILILCIFNIKRIVYMLNSIGILSSHYLYYVNNKSESSNNMETLIYIIEYMFLFFASGKKTTIKDIDFYRIICMLTLVLLQLTRFIYYGNRLSMYFSIVNVIAISKIPQYFKKGGGRNIAILIIVMILFIYWYYYYIISNCGETYPYKFNFT